MTMTNNQKLTAMRYYAYRIMSREHEFNQLLRGGRLFQQDVVNMAGKIEVDRLNYIRLNQASLRLTAYRGFVDALNDNDYLSNIGRRVILSSTFVGGPRYMMERCQDAIMYVRIYGNVNYFITMTCNPNWPEIKENLLENQLPHDRPDIIARVFYLKKKHSIKYLTRLPHLHCLLWMDEESKPRPQNYDDYVQAEIPSRNEDPEEYALVLKHMIHGPNCNDASPMLEKWELFKEVPKTIQTIYYSDVPKYYLWENKKWQRRKPGRRVVDHTEVFEANILCSSYTVSPNTTCTERELLFDGNHWLQTMEDAERTRLPRAMRDLFTIILLNTEVSNSSELWERFSNSMSMNYRNAMQKQANDQNMLINDNTLRYIQDKLCAAGKSLQDFELPLPQNQPNVIQLKRDIMDEQSYNLAEQTAYVNTHQGSLNEEQTIIYEFICSYLDTGSSSLVFIDAPGGTGKIFLIKIILSKERCSGQIALAVVSSGIAATLMPGGKTAHSRFKLPLNFYLKRNMRVEEGDEYSQFLIKIGEDKIEKNESSEIALPVDMIIPASNVDQCIEYIYPSFDNSINTEEFIGLLPARPALWQKGHQDFQNLDVREIHLREVADILSVTVNKVKERLKALKDAMRKQVNFLPKTKSGAPAFGKSSILQSFSS
ncbi:uncharacterized protein LOC143033489 [Oratosquilla oratoria]|uniref:uncharacterized protein LOC143033489 n=1 Tax=Oratosquilla oratoria TaxID=337810 RepID=UPI003F77169D